MDAILNARSKRLLRFIYPNTDYFECTCNFFDEAHKLLSSNASSTFFTF